MTKNEIYKFYESKIDDIQDEEKREKMLEKLEEIDTLLFELDSYIDEELEKQEYDELPYIDPRDACDEFNYGCCYNPSWR